MKTAITVVIVLVIFVPYRLSEYGQDSGFWQDFFVAFVAFGIAAGVTYLVQINQGEEEEEQ